MNRDNELSSSWDDENGEINETLFNVKICFHDEKFVVKERVSGKFEYV